MRIISRRRLETFWKARKAGAETAERDLSTWYKIAKAAEWTNFGSLKQTFGSADQVGNCVVFDVGNNRFRLIGRLNYVRGIIYVLKVLDHREYDETRWAEECGCHSPPPRRPDEGKRPTLSKKPDVRGRKGRR